MSDAYYSYSEHVAQLKEEIEKLKNLDKTCKVCKQIVGQHKMDCHKKPKCQGCVDINAEVERLKDTSSWEAEIDRLTESRRKRQKELTAARQENQRLREALEIALKHLCKTHTISRQELDTCEAALEGKNG
jgi:DNA-binding transcriptional MerR regulator